MSAARRFVDFEVRVVIEETRRVRLWVWDDKAVKDARRQLDEETFQLWPVEYRRFKVRSVSRVKT